VWQRELGEVKNESISHNSSLFAIFLPKIIEIGGNLTKFWQNQFCTVFWDTVYTRVIFPRLVQNSRNDRVPFFDQNDQC